VLEQGQLTLVLDRDLPEVEYFGQRFPTCPASWGALLEAPELEADFAALRALRLRIEPDAEGIAAYQVHAARVLAATWEWLSDGKRRAAVQARCKALVLDLKRFDQFLGDQFYRLAWWKLEGEIVNYRRFFNVGSLVGVRVEHEEIFTASHARVARMVEAGELAGVRVDHPDGLRDPSGYLQRLRTLVPDGRIFVEKILDSEETLPDEWPIDGSVGYEFLSKVNRLWMDENNADALTAAYADFTGHPVNYSALVREKKLQVADTHFHADLERLTTLALSVAGEEYGTRDLSRSQLRRAMALLIAVLPVYRTYLVPDRAAISTADAKVIEDALSSARMLATGIEPQIFDFLEGLFGNRRRGPLEFDFIARFQQLAPAVMAKGAEDTTFYCYDRLVSCNEVGSQPSHLGISPTRFHQFCSHLHSRWPHNMLATSTHDNKRSEDVRARIDVLTELPERWASALQRWSTMNHACWKGREPDRHAEYLLYQTLIGAWPISTERLSAYLLKACREAKIKTSWLEPNVDYEAGLREFTEGIMHSAEFQADLEAFVQPLIAPGRINGLAQTLIKLTAPGFADFYQGTELWDLSLVDPDNRRPVDFVERRKLLAGVPHIDAQKALAEWDTGLPKLFLIHRALQVRRAHAASFQGPHQPLSARGSRLGHMLSYGRGDDVLVVVPRFTLTLGGDWDDTVLGLPAGTWRDELGGGIFEHEVAAAQLFASFPVALLTRSM
jgi:(1->4)-alpha-D-glucan 1-alpha-D-glucosylmutase